MELLEAINNLQAKIENAFEEMQSIQKSVIEAQHRVLLLEIEDLKQRMTIIENAIMCKECKNHCKKCTCEINFCLLTPKQLQLDPS